MILAQALSWPCMHRVRWEGPECWQGIESSAEDLRVQGAPVGHPPCAASVSPPLRAFMNHPFAPCARCSPVFCRVPVPPQRRAACSRGVETPGWQWGPGPCQSLGRAKLRFRFFPLSEETSGMDGTSGPGWPPPSLGSLGLAGALA